MRIVLAGGGTAGHIFPTIAVAERLREVLSPAPAELTIVCGSRELDRSLYRHIEFDLFPIKVRGLIDAGALRLPWRLWRMGSSAAAVWRELGQRRPQVIVASGGYVSVPVMLAGRARRIPMLLFSGDAQIGWATRVLAPLANLTTVAFEEATEQLWGTRVELTGYPLRDAFRSADREAGRARAGAGPNDALVLVMGGSQGAQAINTALARDLEALVRRAVLFHLAGRQDLRRMEAARDALPAELRDRYRLHDFIDQGFADLLAGADLVVSRSGATSVAELTAVGAAAIIVPGRFGAGHQIRTARAMERSGAAITVSEDELPAGRLTAAILELLDDAERLAQMRKASLAQGRPDAAGEVARLAIGLARPARTEARP